MSPEPTGAEVPSKNVRCTHCGKAVRLRKNGTFWHHRSYEREFPGSPFTKLCRGTGTRPGSES
jgi:hypothetical protein